MNTVLSFSFYIKTRQQKPLIDTAQIVCRAGSMKRLGVRPSDSSFDCSSGVQQVCCWVLCRQEISTDSVGAGTQQQRHHSIVHSSKCGQCHVDSRVDEAEHRLIFTYNQGLFRDRCWTVSNKEAMLLPSGVQRWIKFLSVLWHWYSIRWPWLEECKAELTYSAGYIPRWYTHPKMVTDPSTNQVQRRVTLFMH